jgi:hypothetical protein
MIAPILTARLRRNLTIAALIAAAVALSLTICALGYHETDRCKEQLPELRETMLIDHPECVDGGSP